MASILRRQAESLGFLEASRPALERFERPGSLAVVAGQQPGLFGGPLYTLYKALTAIRLAREIERVGGRPAVPIFWVASDDHDFEEVRRTWVNDGSDPEPQVLEYPAAGVPPAASFARIRVGEEIAPLLRRVEELLPSAAFRSQVLEPLRDAYAPGRCWSESFARFMASFVAPLGALFFDPADPEAKALALPVFERELALAGRSSAAARERGEALEALGYHAQITRAGNELNLFWQGKGREPVRWGEDGMLRLPASGREMSREQLLAALRSRPEDASPAVLLRPLVQDYLFPTAAYIGGPSEVAYWGQVYALYPLFDIQPPAIVPRAGATLLEPRVARTLERFSISWESLAGDVEVVIREALRSFLPEDFREAFERERSSLRRSFGRIEETVASFDPSLQSAVVSAAGRIEHEVEALERKLLHVWKRRHDESVQQIRRARAHLFPQGHLQERVCSPIGFAARHGPWLLTRLSEALGPPGSHDLVTLGGTSP